MPGNSSPDVLNGKSDTIPWCSITMDRPLELVKAELTVTAPRDANALEWVLGRILSEFGAEMPSLQEAATELGLKDKVFLRDTLVGLAELGAVELINTTQPLDLRNVRLTTAGRELLREGRTPSLAEHHGVELLFDPVTGEHVAKQPRTLRRKPGIPIIQPDQLPERIQAIGLDRVRELCNRQGEPFHHGESRIVGVTVHVAEGGHLWSPVAVSLGIDRAGVLHADLSAGEAWQAWFNEHGWSLGPLQALDRASTGAWANGRSHVRVPTVPADRWMEIIDCAVPPESTLDEATRLVDSARKEVVVHPGWLDAPGFEAALVRGASRGVRCFVCGAQRALTHWSATDGRTPGFVASGGDVSRPRAFAVVVDRAHGLSVDLVCVRTPGGRELTIEIAAIVKPTSVSALHRELAADVADSLATDDSRELFAAFALTGRIGLWEQGIHLVEVQADGLQRVEELHRWARWGQSLGLEETPAGGWLAQALQSWWTSFEFALQGLDGDPISLLPAAVGLIPPAEVLSRLVEHVQKTSPSEVSAVLASLILYAGHLCRLSPEFHPASGCPRFSRAVNDVLGAHEGPWSQVIEQTVQALTRDAAFQSRPHVWISVLSGAIPRPSDLPSLVAWLDAHVPLRTYLNAAFQQTARQHLDKLRADLQTAAARGNGPLMPLQEVWEELGLPAQELRRIQHPESNNTPSRQTHVSNTRRRP